MGSLVLLVVFFLFSENKVLASGPRTTPEPTKTLKLQLPDPSGAMQMICVGLNGFRTLQMDTQSQTQCMGMFFVFLLRLYTLLGLAHVEGQSPISTHTSSHLGAKQPASIPVIETGQHIATLTRPYVHLADPALPRLMYKG